MNKYNSQKQAKIYIAGPLFSTGEKYEQSIIASILEKKGYHTFLPQRDGFSHDVIYDELIAQGMKDDEAEMTVDKLIFNFDMYQLFISDAIIANINGAHPDSGTVSEVAIAFALGKAIVEFKDDNRTFLENADNNPLLSQLVTVPIVDKFNDIPNAINKALNMTNTPIKFKNLSIQLQNAIILGQKAATKYNKL